MSVKSRYVTADELERMPEGDERVELVKGVLVKEPPAGYIHGGIAGSILAALHAYVHNRKLGVVYAADTGFILSHNPDTVRAPDTAYVSFERVAQQKRKKGFFVGAPDLAVEVISPDDTIKEVDAKVADYLNAGAKQVWVFYPETRTAAVYRSLGEVEMLEYPDTLNGGDVLPGFELPLSKVFEPMGLPPSR